MDQKMLTVTAKWVLVAAGLAWAYEGFTGTDIIANVFGGLEPIVDVVVFGGAAVYFAYYLLNKKSKK